jgi:membrane fusion protein (multidrug efflux system)
VRILKVSAGEAVPVETTGTLFPRSETVVFPEVPGKIARVLVEEGDIVSEGQVLLEQDQTDFRLGIQQAEANLRAAELALATTQVDFERTKRLREGDALAQASFDGMKLKLDLTENQVRLAKIGQSLSNRRLSQTVIRSPFDAIVANRLVSVGAVAQTMPPTALVRLQDVRHLRLKMRVPESRLSSVAVGDPVSARFEAIGRTVDCKVTAVVGSIDPMSRTFDVVADIDNRAEDMSLKPGLFATARILHPGATDSLRIPREAGRAVAGNDAAVRVFLLEGDRVRERTIQVIPADAAGWLVKDGLVAGQEIVASDPSGLVDGASVVRQ